MKCKICNKTVKSLGTHIRYQHKDYTKEEYYKKYINTNLNVGICELHGCKNKTRFWNLTVGYSRYCCNSHAQSDKKTREKIKKTNLKRYGGESPLSSKEIREKSNQTKLKRYGDPKYNNRDKCIETFSNRTDKEWQAWRESVKRTWKNKTKKELKQIYKKLEKTCIKKYGKPPFELAHDAIQEKYGVDNISYIPGVLEKRNKKVRETWKNNKDKILEKSKATMLKRYGVEHIMYNEEAKKHILAKIRETKTKNGTALPPEQIKHYNKYKGQVYNLTKHVIHEKFTEKELSKRGKCGIKGAIQVDHIFTIKDGFINGLSPEIIACKSNLQLISWEENDRKTKSGISKDELLKRYTEEMINN